MMDSEDGDSRQAYSRKRRGINTDHKFNILWLEKEYVLQGWEVVIFAMDQSDIIVLYLARKKAAEESGKKGILKVAAIFL